MQGFRIGILMNDLVCSVYTARIIEDLEAIPGAKLVLLMESAKNPHHGASARLRQQGLTRFASLALFSAWTRLENRFFAKLQKSAADLLRRESLDESRFAAKIDITPQFSPKGLNCTYSAEDVARVREAGLDLIVRGNGGAIFKGEILSAARLGILSFHHGDNRWNRGGPPAFWEVCLRKPSTGFVLQILNETLDGGKVVYRGAIPTCRSWTENLASLYRESTPFLAPVAHKLLTDPDSLPDSPSAPVCHPLYRSPDAASTLGYIFRTASLFGSLIWHRGLMRKKQRWGISYLREDWNRASLSRATRIPNPPGRFLADPFVIEKDDGHYIFVEDLDFSTDQGRISCVHVDRQENIRIFPDIIDMDCHLSFPWIFEADGELFMVPETVEAKQIVLYRCTSFPDKWEKDTVLIDNISAADSMLLPRDGRWYLLTNLNSFRAGADHSSQFQIFTADDFRATDWKPASDLPLIHDPAIARNGGLLRDDQDRLYRVRQGQGFARYGAWFTIAEITDLRPDGYDEREIAHIEPLFYKGLRGSHHMHACPGFTVFDHVALDRA